MKRKSKYLLSVILSFMSCVAVYSQPDKAQQYLREAEAYNKQAEGYEREAQQLTEKANGYTVMPRRMTTVNRVPILIGLMRLCKKHNLD